MDINATNQLPWHVLAGGAVGRGFASVRID